MEAFFAIAGLLAAKVLHREDPAAWISRRALALLLPFFFGTIVVNPLGAMTANVLQHRAVFDHVRLDVGHLWFLPTLFFCCLIVYCFRKQDVLGSGAMAEKVARKLCSLGGISMYVSVAFVGAALLMVYKLEIAVVPIVTEYNRLFARIVHDIAYTVGQVPYYFIFFSLGYGFVQFPILCALVMRKVEVHIAMTVLGVALLTAMFADYGSNLFVEQAPWVGPIPILTASIKAFVAPAASILVVMTAIRVKSGSRFIGLLSRASYTMYVTHVAVIAVLTQISIICGAKGVAIPLLVTPVTLAITFTFHAYVVERSRLLLLFLNGTAFRFENDNVIQKILNGRPGRAFDNKARRRFA